MNSPIMELLYGLLTLARAQATRDPTPENPPTEEEERAVDDYCERLAATSDVEKPSVLEANGMIPRLTCALMIASAAEHAWERQARIGDGAASEANLLRLLLITSWRDGLRAKWLARKVVRRPGGNGGGA